MDNHGAMMIVAMKCDSKHEIHKLDQHEFVDCEFVIKQAQELDIPYIEISSKMNTFCMNFGFKCNFKNELKMSEKHN